MSSSSLSSSETETAPFDEQQQTIAFPASAPAAHSSSDDSLPTNADYYPIAQSESQTNNNLNTANQQDEKQEGDISSTSDTGFFGSNKKTWTHFMKGSTQMMQKWRKFHADLSGRGALYGSDYFTNETWKLVATTTTTTIIRQFFWKYFRNVMKNGFWGEQRKKRENTNKIKKNK